MKTAKKTPPKKPTKKEELDKEILKASDLLMRRYIDVYKELAK